MSETLVIAAGIGLLLAVIALGMEGIRTELKRHQAIDLMSILNRALLAYHQSTESWPIDSAVISSDPQDAPSRSASSPGGAQRSEAERFEPDPAGVDRMIQIMAEVPASRLLLDAVPDVLRIPPGEPVSGAASRPWGSIQDPWGRRLQCLTSASPLAIHRKAVAANQNRPIFVSPGPDGRFGFTDISAASDNIRSDEIDQ